jgi:predicted nucleic acid-binding protein
MIAYLDASVVLRLILGEPHKLAEWKQVRSAVASALTEVECLRTLDRLGRAGALSEKDVATRREEVYRLLESVEVVDVARPILRRASEPFPAPLGTPDAIHLATALAFLKALPDLTMLSLDRRIRDNAEALGIPTAADQTQ